ncbi:energy-coupling factor transporter transmembrane protein EcfT [Leucobacter muris]|uniref:Energy-coupling factor transporter transmembrane protein EcfT n=1 Tax=Leucobacter muris TaxID=1935379 RepID=A0ABX5QCC5_9MICO|nr:energy-coupling factor transporter transmembrane component T [Leucobacter muris]QAB16606.1 energy-coupling factor transporter transmembrane protein EcfT [Leucobacter muris]
MSIHSPLGAYLPGSGPLHRLRPGAKLLGLFGFAIAVVSTTGVPLTAAWLGIAVALAVLAGLRGRDFWRVARGFALIAVPLFAFQAWQHGWERGAEVVGDLFAMILAASAVTASTAVEDMLDTITWALGPLRHLGAKPERVALAFSLVIRAIPTILGVARETQSAARARGLERDPRARLMPLVLRTVAHAQLTGEALSARGVGED